MLAHTAGITSLNCYREIPTAPSATSGSSQPPGLPPDPSSHAGAQVGLVAAYQPPGVALPFLSPPPRQTLLGSDGSLNLIKL